MTNRQGKVCRGAFALATAGTLAITFYFPAIGLGYALDSSAGFESRATGLLLLLPSIAALVLLVAMLPSISGRLLLWLGLLGGLLAVPSITVSAWLGFPAAIGAVAGCAYLGAWWFLARARLSPELPQAAPGSGLRTTKVEELP